MTDWIMIIITFVYVIATIFICFYNYRSARAAKEQVEEMRKQFSSDLQIKMMPCLLIKNIPKTKNTNGTIKVVLYRKDNNSKSIRRSIYFKVYNVGHDIAKEVEYFVKPPIDLAVRYHIISLPVNDYRVVKMDFSYFPDANDDKTYNRTICMYIQYTDLFNNQYSQKLTVLLNFNSAEIRMKTYYLSAPEITDNCRK